MKPNFVIYTRAVASPSRPQGQTPGTELPNSAQSSFFLPIFPDFTFFLWLIFPNVFPSGGGHSAPCPPLATALDNTPTFSSGLLTLDV